MKVRILLSTLSLISISTLSFAQLPASLAEKHPELAREVAHMDSHEKTKTTSKQLSHQQNAPTQHSVTKKHS